MNSKAIKLLSGLCLFLLLVLLCEWLLSGSSEQALSDPSHTEDSQAQVTKLPKLVVNKQSAESYTQMVERPLFIEGRRPVIDEEGEDDVEETGQIEDLVLQGIYSVKGQQQALFNTKGIGRNYLKKSEGEDVNGWLLKEIQTDRVVLEQGDKEQTVMLRKPKPKTPSKPTSAKRRQSRNAIKLNPEK